MRECPWLGVLVHFDRIINLYGCLQVLFYSYTVVTLNLQQDARLAFQLAVSPDTFNLTSEEMIECGSLPKPP